MPTAPSLDVLSIVATRKIKPRNKSMKGNASQLQCTATYVSTLYAFPASIVLLGEDRIALVIAIARRSICVETLFGASHGLNLSKRVYAGPVRYFCTA
jgi:hypothetical protein